MKFLLILVFFPAVIFSQHQERKVFIYNIGFGGLTAGVGAVINKKKDESLKKSFIRGFWQGSVGGLFNYSAKKTIYLIDKNKNFGYAVPARLLSSAGNSIIQNAALNEPFLRNWSLDYWFFRFDFSATAEKKFKIRMLPETILATAISLPKGKFDINTTLLTGIIAFKTKHPITTERGKHSGLNYGRAFIYSDSSAKHHVVSHEIIHEFQYREYLVFNSYLKPAVSKMKNTGLKKILTKYIYPDVPYFGLFYMLEGVHPGEKLFRNYFEFEAEKFATNKFVLIE
jgi:hypothetical protein